MQGERWCRDWLIHLHSPAGIISWRGFWQLWCLTHCYFYCSPCCVCCVQSEPVVVAAQVTQWRQLCVHLPKALREFLCSIAWGQVPQGAAGPCERSLRSETRFSFRCCWSTSCPSPSSLGLAVWTELLAQLCFKPNQASALTEKQHSKKRENRVFWGILSSFSFSFDLIECKHAQAVLGWCSRQRSWWFGQSSAGEMLVRPQPGVKQGCGTHEWDKKVLWMEKEKSSDHHLQRMSRAWRCSTTSLLLKAKLLCLIYSLLFL